ncbi:hypothetical protein PCASD_22084 [Puccinia coronata f. sp. avenae]|uniref:Uncharacterized protein n=1 Tax=Puccinia coronata f. sp. avenae TaxID=200324 RepID=A0A2N5TYE7_9BASI|nr:hypothetical protein PCASD_22084 [Puccinia coronata f. sp. avenae]
MLLALSSDSNPPSSKDDLLVQFRELWSTPIIGVPRSMVQRTPLAIWHCGGGFSRLTGGPIKENPGTEPARAIGSHSPCGWVTWGPASCFHPNSGSGQHRDSRFGKDNLKIGLYGKFNHRDNSRNHHYSTGSEVRALAKYQLP